jgi:hypothetical protein
MGLFASHNQPTRVGPDHPMAFYVGHSSPAPYVTLLLPPVCHENLNAPSRQSTVTSFSTTRSAALMTAGRRAPPERDRSVPSGLP